MSVRYLTKSRFKVGHECRTKLYYLDNPAYQNSKEADAFLKALADGGFQVGELAKIYFEGGVEVQEREHQKAADETRELLKRENVVIFEAAIMFENCFVRVDVLEKKGSVIRLLEVKAKSWRDGDSFTTKKGTRIDSGWEPYIADIAFQTYVARKAYPDFRYVSFLMLADKDAKASVDGIHQRFILKSADGSRTHVEVVPGTTKISVGAPLLKAIPVDNEVALFIEQTFDGKSFEEYCERLSSAIAQSKFSEDVTRSLQILNELGQNPNLPLSRRTELQEKRRAFKEAVEMTVDMQREQSTPVNQITAQINQEGRVAEQDATARAVGIEGSEVNLGLLKSTYNDCGDRANCGRERRGRK